jgi:hypothetical protein
MKPAPCSAKLSDGRLRVRTKRPAKCLAGHARAHDRLHVQRSSQSPRPFVDTLDSDAFTHPVSSGKSVATGLHAAPCSHTPNIVDCERSLLAGVRVESRGGTVWLELVELSDSDCDERGGKTIVREWLLPRGMKTVLQYVTYSTDDPTAAFLWVRLAR